MASLIINTGSETHPQISVDAADFKNGQIIFRWVGGPYSGDCAEPFVISLTEHGDMTINQIVSAIAASLIASLE